jgi:hypothetical protein
LHCRVTYTINWQPDRATWGLNGVPLATKWASSNLPDAQRSGGVTLYQPPSSTGGRRRLLRCEDTTAPDAKALLHSEPGGLRLLGFEPLL